MKQIALWTAITAAVFIIFLVILMVGLLRKKKKAVRFSLPVFLVCAGLGIWTTYLFVNKSYHRISDLMKPRTGMEIYEALFGKTDHTCVTVLQHQDPVVPVIDNAIRLHVKTCPEEMARIIAARGYTSETISTQHRVTTDDDWFKPEMLGDSTIVCTWHNPENYSHIQYLYISQDSTEMFCRDIL